MRQFGAGLVRADALRIPFADESVDLIITSPPYFALRSYQDDGEHYDGQIGSEPTPADFLRALWAVTDECWRVLKPTGSLWVDLGDKYADKSLMGLPWRYALGLTCPDDYRTDGGGDHPVWTLRAEVIWSKPNGLPESVTDRVRRSHETWFHFTKGPRYYAAVDEVRETHVATLTERSTDGWRAGPSGQNRGTAVGRTHHDGATIRDLALNTLGKLPGSVWTIPSEPLVVPAHLGVDHFAAFPQEWPRRIILGWSPPGICTACGEGRRPVTISAAVKSPAHSDGSIMGNRGGGPDERGWDGLPRFNRERTITGYACACPGALAPTRQAVVLDPFAGTGTVPMVARTLGRYGIGLDLSRDYLRLATWRIWHSGHGRKTEARTNRERQGDLFD